MAVDDELWSPRLKLWRTVTVPDCWKKFEKDRSGAINNFDRVRVGKSGGHAGPPWYDGLVYEMIRASADFLAAGPDPELERQDVSCRNADSKGKRGYAAGKRSMPRSGSSMVFQPGIPWSLYPDTRSG